MATNSIVIQNHKEQYSSDINNYQVYYDSSSSLTINDVSSPNFQGKFHKDKYLAYPSTFNGAYWVKFSIKNQSDLNKKWILNIYNFQLDDVRLYTKEGDNEFKEQIIGDVYKFNKKEVSHRSNIFELDLPKVASDYFVRIKSSDPLYISFGVFTSEELLKISLREYTISAILFGVLFALVVYNLLFFVTLRRRQYLYYVLYGLSIALFASSEEGIGFQFLWPDNPSLNQYVFGVALSLISITSLLYTHEFFGIKRKGFLHYCFLFFIGIRILYFLTITIFFPQWLNSFLPDMLPFIFIISAGIYLWSKENKVAIYFLLAQIVFVILFVIDHYDLLPVSFLYNILNLYGFNIGVILQMILLSFALGKRIHELDKQRIVMEEKNKELDTFVYKVSHDLKGPLKSIIGLTTVGMEDPKAQEAKNYFDMILKNTKRLDAILADLVMITKVKQSTVKKEKINFESLIHEILSSLQYYPAFHEMNFKVQVHGTSEFFSDRGLLYSVFQNIIENAIKYKKPSNSPLFESNEDKSYLSIEVLKEPTMTTVIFSDNGLGIPKEFQEKIFEMFFRVETDITGSGLGLYLVKMSVAKLGGKIKVDGGKGLGTTFTIQFDHK
jgi:hypothetical protein